MSPSLFPESVVHGMRQTIMKMEIKIQMYLFTSGALRGKHTHLERKAFPLGVVCTMIFHLPPTVVFTFYEPKSK